MTGRSCTSRSAASPGICRRPPGCIAPRLRRWVSYRRACCSPWAEEFAADALGSIPENTHVEQWVTQSDVFAHAALVVCHGGSGTTFAALAAGVPLVICPLFADQPVNGRLVEAAGCGLSVDAPDAAVGALRALSPGDVAPLRAAIKRVMGDSTYRRAAARVAAETATLPGLDDVLNTLLGN